MSIKFNSAVTKLKGAAPWTLAGVTVGARPIFLYAYGMAAGDQICVRRVVTGAEESGFVSTGCAVNQPVPGAVMARSNVDACGDPVCMDMNNASIQLPEPGTYELVGSGPGFEAGTIIVEETVWTGEHSPVQCPKPIDIASLPPIELKRHVVASEIVCNQLWYIWSDGTKTTETLPECPPVYCPSLRLSCDGQPGYGFHLLDPKDPAATVEMAPCPGDTSMDSIWIFPSAGPGHTLKVLNCDGSVIGYAANRSDCAADCGCPETVINVNNTNNVAAPTVNVAAPEVTVTPVNNFAPTTNVSAPAVTNNFAPTTNVAAPAVTNNFAPTTNVAAPAVTTNVAAPEVNITQAAPNLVAQTIADDGTITSTLSDGSIVTSNPLPSC
jgi:hypothetical protein